MDPHIITAENAPHILEWMRTRGGVAIWRSLDLGNPESWTCPVNDEQGNVKGRPLGVTASKPERIITSTDDIVVHTVHEVARFHVAVCMGQQGLKVKLTDASTAGVKKALDKAGPNAFHAFDYDAQDALIMAPDGNIVTLTQWAEANQ